METLFVVLTSECNRSCPFCFYVTGHQEKVEAKLNIDSITNFLDSLKKLGLRQVIFTGGEPFIWKDLFAVIRNSSEKGFYNLIITNGDFLNEKTIPKLIESRLDAISITLDSIVERRNKNLIPFIRKLSMTGKIPVTVITPVTKKNLEEIEKIYKFSKSFAISQIFQPAFIPENSPSFEELSLQRANAEELKLLRETLDKWSEESGTTGYAELIHNFYEGKNPKPKNCEMGTDIFVLNANGDLIPCFHRENLIIGNILKDSSDDILKNLYKFSDELAKAPCFGEHCISLFSYL